MNPSESVISGLVSRLSDPAGARSVDNFPREHEGCDQPGLYSWWADSEALDALAVVFDTRLPKLIYAGQAGATSTRSHTERRATLASRIGSNHLRGNISSSTFRKTLSACLFEALELHLRRSGSLDRESNNVVSLWMREHLRLSVVPYPDRASLASSEHAVLERLDPPLNLMGMPPTPTRLRLSELRARLQRLP